MGQIRLLTRAMPYIALEEIDFLWSLEDVYEFELMWTKGVEKETPIHELIHEIAEYFNRDVDEVAVLVMCRKRKGRI